VRYKSKIKVIEDTKKKTFRLPAAYTEFNIRFKTR